MSAARTRIDPAPRGLNRGQAAAHVGVSATTFDKMVAAGLMPAARAIFSLRVWDIEELDRAFDALPHADAPARGSLGARSGADSPAEDFV